MRIHKVFSLLLTSLALAALSAQAQDEVAYDLAGVYGDTGGPSAFTAPGTASDFHFVVPATVPASQRIAFDGTLHHSGSVTGSYTLGSTTYTATGVSSFTGNLGRGNTSVSFSRSGTEIACGDLAVHVTGTAGGMSPVPEPSTWSLMAVGLISCGGLAYVRRRRSGVA